MRYVRNSRDMCASVEYNAQHVDHEKSPRKWEGTGFGRTLKKTAGEKAFLVEMFLTIFGATRVFLSHCLCKIYAFACVLYACTYIFGLGDTHAIGKHMCVSDRGGKDVGVGLRVGVSFYTN